MIARRVGIWEPPGDRLGLIALTDWMMVTGELDADYDFAFFLAPADGVDVEQARGSATRATVLESIRTDIPLTELAAGETNALTIARTDGPGRLYYTAHLQIYLPVEQIEAADRGFVVSRRYTLASCEATDRRECPEVREVKLGDVIRVDLTLITPYDRYYVVVEDPLPAAAKPSTQDWRPRSLSDEPSLTRENNRWWWWWRWYSRSELRDEKSFFSPTIWPAGAYEYSSHSARRCPATITSSRRRRQSSTSLRSSGAVMGACSHRTVTYSPLIRRKL